MENDHLGGRVAAGDSVLILGATGASGHIAAQLAKRQGSRGVVAGRSWRALDDLIAKGADAAIRVNQPHDLAAAISAEVPYDLVADYLWGAPAEAVFAALAKGVPQSERGRDPIRYILVGMSAGELAQLLAMALRCSPVQLLGSGTGRAISMEEAAAGCEDLLQQAAAGEITLETEVVPLSNVEKTWSQADDTRRVVLVP